MKKILFAVAVALAAVSLRADADGYLMLSVFSPGQLPTPSSSICGGRLSFIYGECHELYGLDIGLSGYVRERMCGVQLEALWNGVGTDMDGFQLGLVNTFEGDMSGLQIGLVNVADQLYGCQLGLVNVADHLYGCQLGLVNVVTDRAWTFWPFINIGW